MDYLEEFSKKKKNRNGCFLAIMLPECLSQHSHSYANGNDR